MRHYDFIINRTTHKYHLCGSHFEEKTFKIIKELNLLIILNAESKEQASPSDTTEGAKFRAPSPLIM